MLPADWEIVNSIAGDNGQSRSAVMRTITRQYPVSLRLLFLGQALLVGLVTPTEALERLSDLAMDIPLPISLTEAGEAVLAE